MTRPTQGTLRRQPAFAYGPVTLCGRPFQIVLLANCLVTPCGGPYNPAVETTAVWAISLSLAATEEIDFSFFSCGYLDVSVLRVSHCSLWIQPQPVRESRDHHLFDGYPGLFAAFRALQSLLMPRHPPCALGSLTTRIECSQSRLFRRLATLRIIANSPEAVAPFGEVTFSLSIDRGHKAPTNQFALGERCGVTTKKRRHPSAFFKMPITTTKLSKIECAERIPPGIDVVDTTLLRRILAYWSET